MGVDTGNASTDIGIAERTPDAERSAGERARLSHVVVEAVTAALDCEPTEISPLHQSIDLDALDDLFRSHRDGTHRTGGHVAFVHGECEVVVEPDRVRVFCD